MSNTHENTHRFARFLRTPHVRLHLTFGHLWRLIIVFLLTTLFVLGAWAGSVPAAYAASLVQQPTPTPQVASTRSTQPTSSPRATPSTPLRPTPPSAPPKRSERFNVLARQARVVTPHTATVSQQTPFNGLGDLPFYTYVYHRNLTDQLEMKVNVANGNLLLHATPEHITGTGINLNLDSYFNSQFGDMVLDDGYNWNFGYGRGLTLDLSTPTTGITLYGPSGYAAFFPSAGGGKYTDAPGLNATLVFSSGNYDLQFHRTGAHWLFNGTYGTIYEILDKNGNNILFSYDMNGNLTSLQDTQGRTVTFTQNAAHQITTIKDSAGRTTTYAYSNPYLDLISITNPNNEVTQFGYDSSDRVTSITDPNGKQTLVSYSSTGQVTQITDANTGQTKFTYNSGNTVVTDANTHATTYTYNSRLQVTKTTDANNHSSTSTYDSTNYNVTQTGDALSDFSNFTFSSDGRNNVTSDTLGVNGSESGAKTTFGYPSSGNNLYYPLSQTDPSGNVTSFAYDTNGNLTSAKDNNTGHTLVYTYNSNGTVATQKDANGNLTTFGYDIKGNLTSITPPSPLGKTTLTVDGLSRVTSVTDGNTQKTTYTYDNADRVKTITYADSSLISYTYDKNGNVLSETDNTGLTSFQYDGLNRITLKTLPGGTTISMGYDNVGNLTSYNDGTGKVTYTYDPANRMTVLTEPDGAQTTYGYDAANRKTSIQYPNGTGMLMTYFATGQRRARRVAP